MYQVFDNPSAPGRDPNSRVDSLLRFLSDQSEKLNYAFSQVPEQTEPGEKESAQYPGCFYKMVGKEAEWVNPPFLIGQEYRTSQRSSGRPLYASMVEVPVATGKTTSKALERYNIRQIVRVFGYLEANGFSLPFIGSDPKFSIYMTAKPGQIIITAGTDMPPDTAYIEIWYTK